MDSPGIRKYLGIKIISLFHKDEGANAGVPEKSSTGVHKVAQTSEPLAPVPEKSLIKDAVEEEDKSLKKQDKEQLKHAKKLGKQVIKQQKKQKNP